MSAELIAIVFPTCMSCNEKPGKFVYQKRNFCSNKCVRAEFGNPKLDPSSVHLYTIKTGNDNADSLQHTERTLRNLTKAIVRTSKKTVKAKYTHNEGALPREWR